MDDKIRGSHILWLSMWWTANIAFAPKAFELIGHLSSDTPIPLPLNVAVSLWIGVHAAIFVLVFPKYKPMGREYVFGFKSVKYKPYVLLSLISIIVCICKWISEDGIPPVNKWADKHIGD